jgi:hypothetical protein
MQSNVTTFHAFKGEGGGIKAVRLLYSTCICSSERDSVNRTSSFLPSPSYSIMEA